MEQRQFQYWQWPGLRWLVLVAGGLQLVSLAMQISDWQAIAGAGIFSAAEWQRYCAREALHCGCSGLMAAGFLGCFVIGQRAKSRRAARRDEGVLLLALAVVWAVGGVGLRMAVAVPLGQELFELAVLAALAAGGGVALWQSARLLKTTSGEETAK